MSLLKRFSYRCDTDRVCLYIVWLGIFLFAAGCGMPEESSSNLVVAIVLTLLAMVAVTLIVVGLTIYVIFVRRSSIATGVYLGVIVGVVVVTTLPVSIQLTLIGGLLGISLDKIASQSNPPAASTVIDRLSESITQISNSIKSASTKAGQSTSVQSIRIGMWTFSFTFLLFLLVGRVGESIGLRPDIILYILMLLLGREAGELPMLIPNPGS